MSDRSLESAMKLQERVKGFEGILNSIESLDDRKRALWREIYENAITDRVNAYTLFVELHGFVKGDPNLHAIQGPLLAKYLERMSKSTDQMIRLAELIAEAEKISEAINPEDIYGATQQIRGTK